MATMKKPASKSAPKGNPFAAKAPGKPAAAAPAAFGKKGMAPPFGKKGK